MSKKNLPALADLHHAPEQAFKADQFKTLLYNNPPEAWIKLNKFANNSKYLPIDKVEYLLDRIFQEWRIEVIHYAQLFNSISCHVRVHIKHPVTGEWTYQDGVGAADVQVKAGSSPSELANINKNAVGMALPISKSYAIKDACHHLGRVFGKDLNRADVMEFNGAYMADSTNIEDLQLLFDMKQAALTAEELTFAKRIIDTKEAKSYKKLHTLLMSK